MIDDDDLKEFERRAEEAVRAAGNNGIVREFVDDMVAAAAEWREGRFTKPPETLHRRLAIRARCLAHGLAATYKPGAPVTQEMRVLRDNLAVAVALLRDAGRGEVCDDVIAILHGR